MSKLGKPRFSIVIPCYNEANFIGAALGSLQAQHTEVHYEIIVVNNNCTDDTVALAKRYGVKVVSENEAGVCWARQAGTQAAKGEIIISTDADTIFSPLWLDTIDKKFRQNKELVAVAGPCRYYNGPWWGKLYPHILFMGVYIYHILIGHPFYVTATNIAFKRSAWESYDVNLMQGGDELDLLHELRKKGRVSFINSNPVYTSARRLTRGLAYNLLISFLFYYLGAYYINKFSKRTIIGAAPAFRENGMGNGFSLLSEGMITCSLVVLIALMSISPFRNDLFEATYNIADAARDSVSYII